MLDGLKTKPNNTMTNVPLTICKCLKFVHTSLHVTYGGVVLH